MPTPEAESYYHSIPGVLEGSYDIRDVFYIKFWALLYVSGSCLIKQSEMISEKIHVFYVYAALKLLTVFAMRGCKYYH